MSPIVPRRPPIFLPSRRQRPYFGPPPFVPHPHAEGPEPPPPPSAPMKLMALVWATWNQSAPSDFTQLVTTPCLKGYQFGVWRDALTTRVIARGGNPATEILETGTTIQLVGEAVIDLCSMFDLVFLGHWFSKPMIEAIKARSTVPGGTKIVFWSNIESSGHGLQYIAAHQIIDQLLDNVPLVGVGLNSYGCSVIDKYEMSVGGTPGCPHTPPHAGLSWPSLNPGSHTFDVDLYAFTSGGDPVQTQLLWDEYGFAIGTHLGGPLSPIDGLCFDNLLTNPYKGTASNDYPPDWPTKYVAGWRAVLEGLVLYDVLIGVYGPDWLWANGPVGVETYTREHIRNRYLEHFFRKTPSLLKTWPELETDLQTLATQGLHGVLGLMGTEAFEHFWAITAGGPNPQTYGNWAQIVQTVRTLQATDRIYVAAWQTFSEAYAFWQEGFREPS